MKAIVLFLFLFNLPKYARADILHIKDESVADNSKPAGEISLSEKTDFTADYTALPGSGWEFGFAFKESPEKFQWRVAVSVENDTRVSGHEHTAPPLPLFYYPDWPGRKTRARLDGIILQSPQLDQRQRFVVHLATVNYAAKLTARGTYTLLLHGKTLHPTLTHTLVLKTPGIEALPRNDRLYRSSGGTGAHADNHHGTAVTLAALKDLAAAWRNIGRDAPLLEIGDISLPWGGALDTKADWKSATTAHAYGIAADIEKKNYTEEERAELLKLICGTGFYAYNTAEEKKEHYHIIHKAEFARLKGLNWPVRLPGKADTESTDCCATKPGTPDRRKCTSFSEMPQSRRRNAVPAIPAP